MSAEAPRAAQRDRNQWHIGRSRGECVIRADNRVGDVLCSINTAWLSVASSVAALIVPAAYGVDGSVEWIAMCLAAIFTVLGAWLLPAVSITPASLVLNMRSSV